MNKKFCDLRHALINSELTDIVEGVTVTVEVTRKNVEQSLLAIAGRVV